MQFWGNEGGPAIFWQPKIHFGLAAVAKKSAAETKLNGGVLAR